MKKGKEKSPGSATTTSRSQSLTPKEEERDTNQQAQNKEMHEKHTDQFSLPQVR